MTKPEDSFLDDIFATARGAAPQPSDDLMARIMADAAGASPQPPLWKGVFDMIGGWPALGGLVAAGVAGIWVGIAPPPIVTDLTADILGASLSVDLLGETDVYFTEGFTDG